MRLRLVVVCMVLVALGVLSCKGAPPPPLKATVSPSPMTVIVQTGQNVELTAKVEGAKAAVYKWRVLGEGALKGEAAPTATFTAPGKPTSGSVELTVTDGDRSVVASWQYQVPTPPAPPPPPPPPLPAAPTCTIEVPTQVSMQQGVTGKCSGVPADHAVWLVEPLGGKFHPQSAGGNAAACRGMGCNAPWASEAWFGQPKDKRRAFVLSALVAGPGADSAFHEYLEGAAKARYPGMDALPAGTTALFQTTVTRK